MTYRAGMGPGMEKLGFVPGPPVVICDACGLIISVENSHGFPLKWFMDGKPPPGWKRIPKELSLDGSPSKHYCGRCKGQYA